ncbi:hypothetical protein E2I00_000031, partial [Balaenoptera physalus]
KPSPPVVSGPAVRVTPEQTVSFTCKSHGFSPRNISLKWFKNGNELSASQTNVEPEENSVSYSISSTTKVVLAPGDHPMAGNQLNVTCQVSKFYPQRLQLTWLENGNVSRIDMASTLTENKDGTFNRTSWLLVNSSAHREAVLLTCQVEHDGQPAVTKNHTLEASAPQKNQDADEPLGEASTPTDPVLYLFFNIKGIIVFTIPCPPTSLRLALSYLGLVSLAAIARKPLFCVVLDKADNWNSIFIVVGVVCALLVALLIAALYLLRIRQKKAKGSTSSTRLHEPEKNTRETAQIQDNNDITYADLNLPKGKKSTPKADEPNNHTEYASIQARPPPVSEDTLTYADLDMVHLNRNPKQPAPKPEPSYSEYASVQVQRK